jgi:hypothetical protein
MLEMFENKVLRTVPEPSTEELCEDLRKLLNSVVYICV